MTKLIEFYFDFVSPYSFLAYKQICKIEKKMDIEFTYKPILLGGLHNLRKSTAPAFIEGKKKYMIDDCKMIAQKFDIKFQFNKNFPINTVSLMRGILTIDESKKKKYLESFFEAYWSSNLDLSNNDIVKNILEELNIDSKYFFKKINEDEIKNLLKKLTQDAYDKEIFGAPTFIVNNKLFWGQDRLNYALDEYKNSI